LQELEQLIDSKDIKLVVAIISSWVPAYNKLALDNDRRVRELSQVCLGKLIRRVQKQFAPHLKQILGVWLMVQCDPHPPCASVAFKVFQELFTTSAKQSDVADFCRVEVFNFLEDIMFKLTIQSIIEMRICEEEEVESRFIRLLSSSIDALTKFIEIVNDKHREEIMERIRNNLFSNSKFWKFPKSKIPQVRKAYYDLIATLLKKYGTPLLNPKSKEQITISVLCSIDENDITVIPSVWNALIVLLCGIDDVWSSINMSKAFIPKLWNTIDKCGHGCASVTHPNIVLILEKLPANVKFQKNFCASLLEKLVCSLINEKMLMSWREYDALVASFVECCKFYIFNIVEKRDKAAAADDDDGGNNMISSINNNVI
ncbi:hypothetical protein HELRODRAFT_82814, partial [Helobdella robusta]|uniref:E3 ubiquitin-protein ligase listerin n=1 Tax=Helobdella robusta TaxID=6412 RepID=T1G4X0_HELRO